MRRYYLSLLALVVAFVLLLQIGYQEQAKVPDESQTVPTEAEPETVRDEAATEVDAVQRVPEITFEKTVHDFGEVAAGQKYSGQFKFTNTGDDLLKITEVKRCCGAVTKLSKEELEPGESGVLNVEYKSGLRAGLINRRLYVSSNDKKNPKVTLTIKAKIVPKVEYEPKRIRLVLNKEEAGCPNITLTSLDKKLFSIKTFQSTGGSITADLDASAKATEFVLEPKVDLEKLKSRSAGYISIGLTHPELNRVTIYFSTLQRFQVTPRSIMLYNPEPQEPTVTRVTVASNYGEDFEIESTSSKNGLAKVLSWHKTAKGYQLEVEITPPPPDDTGKATDVLYVQLKDDEKLSIKCYVRYVDKNEQ